MKNMIIIKKNKKKLIIISLLIIVLSSCVPQNKILYLQNIPKETELSGFDYEPILKIDDLLHIQIKTINNEISDPYNLNAGYTNNLSGIRQGYLIDKNGNIDFPVLGKIKAAGVKKSKFTEDLKKLLGNYLKDFSLDIRVANYKITIEGEVTTPGIYNFETERITIFDAIAKAGDLTIFANRTINLYREENNILKSYKINLTKSEFIKSEVYYLRQNDVIYVEPRRAKADNIAISSNITTTISIISSLLTIYLITTRQ